MDQKRLFLYLVIVLTGFSLWTAWQREHAPAPTQKTDIVIQHDGSVPQVTTKEGVGAPPEAAVASDRSQWVNVRTDLLSVWIDPKGGRIVQANLLAYPETLKKGSAPITILSDKSASLYVGQSGITGAAGPDTAKGPVTYSTDKKEYTLAAGKDQVVVNLTWSGADGVQVTKRFVFARNKYAFKVDYQVNNRGGQTWTGNLYAQLQRKRPSKKTSMLGLHTYDGAAMHLPSKPYKKLNYSALEKENINQLVTGGWVAMQQRYFLSAWVPSQSASNHYYSQVSKDDVFTVGFVGPALTVKPGQSIQTGATFYVGPEDADRLGPLAAGLNLTVDYGWLWMISIAIFWVMKHIHTLIGNWGWSIVLVTLLIKLLFYKLSETSYRSMAKMRTLQPKLNALKQQFGDDRQKMGAATMELYRKEKVNPMGGCLPILLQIPFFIALYYVLIESVQLRHAPFMFWIHDLSSKDPFYVLPVLMGLSMLLQQKMSPAPPDPMQAKMMMLMPVVFTILFVSFPSGLVLYWLVNNGLSVLQQWYIMRRFADARGSR